jgi:hypothetical protein
MTTEDVPNRVTDAAAIDASNAGGRRQIKMWQGGTS